MASLQVGRSLGGGVCVFLDQLPAVPNPNPDHITLGHITDIAGDLPIFSIVVKGRGRSAGGRTGKPVLRIVGVDRTLGSAN